MSSPPRDVGEFVEFVLDLSVFGRIRCHLDVAVIFHTGTGRDQASHDDVFLQTTQVIDAAGNGSFSQNAGRFLEARRRYERVGRKRRLRDTEQQRFADGCLAAFVRNASVFVLVTETVNLFLHQEIGVADFLDAHPAEHLPDDHLDVLVVDLHALESVELVY